MGSEAVGRVVENNCKEVGVVETVGAAVIESSLIVGVREKKLAAGSKAMISAVF